MRGRLSRRFTAALASGLTAVALGVTLPAAAAAVSHPVQDPVPIDPNQYFSGFINGSPPGAVVIKVICPGPANTGHPLAHQPVEVEPVPSSSAADVGFTGSRGKKITASLGPSASTVVIGSFTSYFVKKNIPTNITVPCSGSGTAVFIPSPGSKTARSATLPVTFANIAATH
jgi:hypothetical protein